MTEEQGITESRFAMWRAVTALVHADNVVVPEERAFLNHYLEEVPFSAEQKEALLQDMEEPHDVWDMFPAITEPEDQSQFFLFARMLVWCDGDLDAQEEALLDRLSDLQMQKLDQTALHDMIVQTREDSRLERMEDEQGSLSRVIKSLFGG